jgi:hypothetical protein
VSRESKLSRAIENSNLSPRDYRIFGALLHQHARWQTAVIADRWQPSLAELADEAGISKQTLCTGLDHLERHGWISRSRSGGRNRTAYQLNAGINCDCAKPDRAPPKSDADRARAYRARKRAVSRDATVQISRDATVQISRINCPASRDESAGQDPFSPKEGIDEGGGVMKDEAFALCAVCQTPMNPVVAAAGFQTHPNCDDTEVRRPA